MADFTGLGYDEALARARALVPALRERAARSRSVGTSVCARCSASSKRRLVKSVMSGG